MASRVSVLFASAAALLAAAPRASAGPADDYLVRAEAVASKGASFVSFVPSAGWCSAEWQAKRLSRWKARVAGRVGAARESDVEVRAWDEPFRARVVVGIPFADWLEPGTGGIETFAPDGGPSVATNRFAVEAADDGYSVCRLEFRPDRGVFELDSAQVAGTGIWLLPWRDLEARWERRLREPGGGDAVRAEIWSVRKERADGPGSSAWKERTDAFIAEHPDVWPGVRFSNASGAGVWVEILHGETPVGGKEFAPAGGECTKRIERKWKDGKLQWRAWPREGGLCGDDYGASPLEGEDGSPWSPFRERPLTVSIDGTTLNRKPPPRIPLDGSLFPAAALASLREDGVRVSVRYGDGAEENRPVSSENGRLYATVDPHRPVAGVSIRLDGVPGLPAETELAPRKNGNKDFWCCGETVEPAGRVEWLPWPAVSFRNDGPKPVVHRIRLLDAAGKNALGKTVRLELARGETKKFVPGADLPGVPSLTLDVVSSADACDDKTTTLPFVRGAPPQTLAPALHARTFPWPTADLVRWVPVVSSERAFRKPGGTFPALRDARERRNYLDYYINGTATNLLAEVAAVFPDNKSDGDKKKTVPADWYKAGEVFDRLKRDPDDPTRRVAAAADVFAVVREHLNTCLGSEDCPCLAFRKTNGEWLAPIGRATPDDGIYLALYHDWMSNAQANRGKPRAERERAVEARAAVLGYDKPAAPEGGSR